VQAPATPPPLSTTSAAFQRTRHPDGSLAPLPAYTGATILKLTFDAVRMLLRTPKSSLKPESSKL
jgi:hypothetical protein